MKYYSHKAKMPKLNLPPMLKVFYSRHAVEESYSDVFGLIPLCEVLKTAEYKLVEYETDDTTGEIVKITLQKSHSAETHLNIAIGLRAPKEDGALVVRTVYLSRKQRDWRKPFTKVS
jgi:hypothetical protein